MPDITFPACLTLAAVDAVNPCALVVLLLVLIAILTRYPREPKKVLQAGFAFIAAIFVMYMIYGLVLVNVFKILAETPAVTGWFYVGLGAIGIALGAANIKDFFRYGAGFVTEVPRKWRPRMKRLIAGTTSPKGALIIGLFVAFFLTPCTMGPYLIFCGILKALPIFQTILWLLPYNFIFILPMLAITLIIYFGFTTIDRIYGWRERNIKLLHLIAGILLVGIALFLLFKGLTILGLF